MATKGRGNQQSIRVRYFKTHPNICTVCGYPGFVEVHHIIPVSNGGGHNDENLTSLCEVCHDIAHGKKNKKNYLDKNRKYWVGING